MSIDSTIGKKTNGHGGKSNGNGKHSAVNGSAEGPGMKIARRYTQAGHDPLLEAKYEHRSSAITNPDGSKVFEMKDAEIPVEWSQLATDIVVSKYFRKSGLHGKADLGETSVRQVVHRIAHTIRSWGQEHGYFASAAQADSFEAELGYLMVHQYGAFNSPVWFNCGLFHEYKIEGSGGNWAWNEASASVQETANAYGRPQCSACFIQSVSDDLMSIFDLVKNEARLFKYGSGTGTNFSALRARQEKLSGGGTSSGLMSFLEVFDRAAGSTKSGGTTRRAAKMVCLDLDHPEIKDFIGWKQREEKKAQALIREGYPSDFNGEAYHTISGQNSNNSIRVTDEFMHALERDGEWSTRFRTTGEKHETFKAKELWRLIAEAAWGCADPGLQYDTTINDWHTVPNSGRINASNPCSEYMHLDDTACNLSSLNLTKFLRDNGKGGVEFDVEGYRHAARIFFMAQEILVDLSSYPTQTIAKNSHDYRPLGLGYANLGTLLMLLGLPYDSEEGRAVAGALTAILTGHAYRVSAEMAKVKGPFAGYARNREPMLRVMRKHREAAHKLDVARSATELQAAAREDWDEAVKLGEQYGYRNAQATVLAPTGTIGLLMDCDTTGIEPDFALVKYKKLAGGGYFKITNASVESALRLLGYSPAQVADILAWVQGTNTFVGAPHVNRGWLEGKGLTSADIRKAESGLRGAFTLDQALAPYALGPEAYERLGISKEVYSAKGFSALRHLGLSKEQIDEATDHVIGRMTVEGAPHLKDEHYAVFDCANRCGKHGKRFLAPIAHVKMMAAAQPFLSGAISKTVNLPNDATVEDVEEIYYQGWKLGLKAVALYRDGCKASQPLSTSADDKKDKKADKKLEAKAEAPAKVETKVEAPVKVEAPAKAEAPAGSATLRESASQDGPLFVKKPMIGPRHSGRFRLPARRGGFTQEAKVGGHKLFLRTGEYHDGQLGEIFIDMHKEGAAFRSLMNCFAIAVSLGLQHGVPLDAFVQQFTFTRFEPQGTVENDPNVKFATSIVDYVFRVLGVHYLHRYDLAHVPPAPAREELTRATDSIQPEVTTSAAAGTETARPQPEGQATLDLFAGKSAGGFDTAGSSELNKSLGKLMGDAPMCDQCGHMTVRNGSCYRCLNCGASMGCS